MSEGGSARKGSGFDKKQVAFWQNEYEKLDAERATAKAEYMNKCAQVSEQQSQVLDRAKTAGIPNYAITSTTKIKKLDERKAKIMARGDTEQQETLEQYMHALGMLADTPLGKAAAESRTKGMPGAEAAATH